MESMTMDEFNEAAMFEDAVALAGDFPTMPADELMRRLARGLED
jgi:hypothetical protein